MLPCERCKKNTPHIYDGYCSDCLSDLLDEVEAGMIVSACERAHLRESELMERQIKKTLFGSR